MLIVGYDFTGDKYMTLWHGYFERARVAWEVNKIAIGAIEKSSKCSTGKSL